MANPPTTPNHDLVGLYVQYLGLFYLLYTFLLYFYWQILGTERGYPKSFVYWIKNYVIVWMGMTLPLLFLLSQYSFSVLWGFQDAIYKVNQSISFKIFNFFEEQIMPFDLISIVLLLPITFIELSRIKSNTIKLLFGIIYVLFFVLFLPVFFPEVLQFWPYTVMVVVIVVYFVWFLGYWILEI